MARVTVEDCVTVVPNRFELCLLANRRAQDILAGAVTNLDETEKPSVIALREIAEKLVDTSQVRENVIDSTQHKVAQIIEEAPKVLKEEATLAEDDEDEEKKNPTALSDNIFLEDNLNIDD